MYITGNPVPSAALEDMADNAQVFDNFVNSSSTTTPNRNGASVKTRAGFEADHDSQIATHENEHDAQMQSFENDFDSRLAGMAFTRVGTFTTGATLTDMRQTLLWEVLHGGDGHEYGWTGSFGSSGKVVAAGSTPETTGGIGAGAWVDRTDLTLRTELLSSAAASDGMVGGIWLHAKQGDVEDFLLKVKQANDSGGGVVVWPAAEIQTNGINIGNNINDPLGYFGLNSISNVTIYAWGVKLIPLSTTGNMGELVNLIDATDCNVYGFTADGLANTHASSRLGIRMAGCVRCTWTKPVVLNAGNYSLIVSGSQFGIGTRDGAYNTVNYAYVKDQRVWTGNSAAQIIAANGANTTKFNFCISANYISTPGIDLFDDDDAPRTEFNWCVAIGTSANGFGFWLEGSEHVAESYRNFCYVFGCSGGFGSSESRWAIDTGCKSYGVSERGLWSRNGKDVYTNCWHFDCLRIQVETGAKLINSGVGVVNNANLPYMEIYSATWNDGLIHISGGKYGKIYAHDSGVKRIDIDGADVLRIETYNHNAIGCRIKQRGGVLRDRVYLARGTYIGELVDYLLSDGTAPIYGSIESNSAKVRRGQFSGLSANAYAGVISAKLEDSTYISSPYACDFDEIYLSGATPVTVPDTSPRGVYHITVKRKDLANDCPGLVSVIGAAGNATARTITNQLSQPGYDGTTLSIAWASGASPTVAKSSSSYDGIYKVSVR